MVRVEEYRDTPPQVHKSFILNPIIVKPPDFLRGSRDPHPVPMQR